MRRRLIGIATAFAALLLWLFAPADAIAARSSNVTLDLRPQDGSQVPTHLCVVSEGKGPRTRKFLSQLLESEPTKNGGNGRSWRVKAEAWGGTKGNHSCANDPIADCQPRVELPQGLTRDSDLHVACTPDSLISREGATVDPRLLVVFLEHLGASPPSVDSIRLTGGIATIGVDVSLANIVVSARSLGGHYVPHARSYREADDRARAGKLVSLPIEPRCQWVEVTLPRTRLEPGDRERLSVRVHGISIDVDRCVQNLDGSDVIRVNVPRAPLGVGTLDLELAPSGNGGPAGARFGGRWNGALPGNPFTLDFNQLRFSWERPECIYPLDRCPEATLETGTICSAEVTKTGCDYRCPEKVAEGKAIALELPLDVTFEKTGPRQRWTDKLAQNGQKLSSYLPSDEVYLDANLNKWEMDRPGNRIKRVEIYGEDGQAQKKGVTHVPNLRLRVRGASCEPLRFKPVGDRAYDEGLAIIKNGKIEFGDPEKRARRISFSALLAFGGGPAWPKPGALGGPPLYFAGLGQFAVQFRPRKGKASRLGVEFRVGGTLGQWGLTRESEDPNVESAFDRITWARVFGEPGIVYDVTRRLTFGTGLGLGMSFPIREEELTSDAVRFILSPSLDGRVVIRRFNQGRAVALMLQFRGIFLENALELDQMTDVSTQTASSFLTLAGIQATF